MEKWICCGHDIEALCEKTGALLPPKCFFCGKVRGTTVLEPQPEDDLAFELAEIWCAKIREFHGDPDAHVPSLDQYGRTDVEAWRAVARKVLEKWQPHFNGNGQEIAPDNSRFILFNIYENNRRVGSVTLLTTWSENDVMTELQSRGYPTGGMVKFTGWPSAHKFTIAILSDELHVFCFSARQQ